MSRISTGLAGVLCILLAIALYGGTAILDVVYFAYSIRGALFVVLLFGIYWRFTSQRGAIWSMIVTGAVGLFWVAYKAQTGSFPISPGFSETYAAVITATLSTIIFSYIFQDKKITKKSKVRIGAENNRNIKRGCRFARILRDTYSVINPLASGFYYSYQVHFLCIKLTSFHREFQNSPAGDYKPGKLRELSSLHEDSRSSNSAR